MGCHIFSEREEGEGVANAIKEGREGVWKWKLKWASPSFSVNIIHHLPRQHFPNHHSSSLRTALELICLQVTLQLRRDPEVTSTGGLSLPFSIGGVIIIVTDCHLFHLSLSPIVISFIFSKLQVTVARPMWLSASQVGRCRFLENRIQLRF